MSEVRDRWATGSSYEEFMGRWSRRLAPRFVAWLQAPEEVHWLDVGCGTGALAYAIGRHAAPASVVGCDPAAPLLEYALSHTRDARTSFVVAGVGSLPRRADGYGSVTSLLALNFFPDPGSAVREMRSLAAAGAPVSACVWDYGGRMEYLRRFWDAAASLDPAARELDEGVRFPVRRPGGAHGAVSRGRSPRVSCEPIEIPTEFSGFEDLWRPLLGGTGPAPSFVGSLA